MKDGYFQIGQRIRHFRKELGLTQEAIAERTGLDWSFIGQIERGQNIPSIRTLFKIAKAVNINVSDLFTDNAKNPTDGLLLKEIAYILSNHSSKDKRFLLKLIKDISSHIKKK